MSNEASVKQDDTSVPRLILNKQIVNWCAVRSENFQNMPQKELEHTGTIAGERRSYTKHVIGIWNVLLLK